MTDPAPDGDTGRAPGRRLVLSIALSLFSTTLLTSLLGFVYWAVAARMASADSVGRAAAVLSAMQLIAAVCVLGIPTYFVGHLNSGGAAAARRLVVTAAVVTAGLGAVTAASYALLHVVATGDREWMYTTVAGVGLFALGTALTAITGIVDGALIGVRQSWRQVTRNLVFSVVKLAALPAAAALTVLSAPVIFVTWMIGTAVSLAVTSLFNVSGRRWFTTRPDLAGLRSIWRTAFGHHWVNLAFHVPYLAMPVMVAAQLGNTVNAAFYAALLIANFVWTAPRHLGESMFAIHADDSEHFAQGFAAALRLSAIISVAAVVGAPLLAGPALAIFGPEYETARPALVIMVGVTFASAVKAIYVAVRRSEGRLGVAARAVSLGMVLELASVQAALVFEGTLTWVAAALAAAMAVEAVFFWPAVNRARQGRLTSERRA